MVTQKALISARSFIFAAALAFLALILLSDLRTARSLGSNLSPTADPFSEANTIRAGINYRDGGFFANAMLPNIGGAAVYLDEGFCTADTVEYARQALIEAGGGEWATRSDAEVIAEYKKLTGASVVIREADAPICPDFIYTHYPQLAEIVAGLFLRFYSLDQVWALRGLPLVLTFLGELWLLWEFRARFGGLIAGLGIVLLASVGAVRLFSHGLHHQSYSLALLLMYFAAVLAALRNWERPAFRRAAAVIIGALAFLQGWLTFDFLFLMSLRRFR